MKGLNVKSNEGLIYSFLGWSECGNEIQSYENCKKTGTIGLKEPSQCYDYAKTLQLCYAKKAMKIEPLCLPIFNDARECLFQADSHIINCKQQINELIYCQKKPQQYIQFLKISTPHQKQPKSYDFVVNAAQQDFN